METSSRGPQRYERKRELGLFFESSLLGAPSNDSYGKPFLSFSPLRSAFGEFLGTLFFLFNVITVARFVGDRGGTDSAAILLVALAFGTVICVLVYIMADVSGAHLNPAVSIGLLVGKRISVECFFVYVVCQCLGALAGAAIATTFLAGTGGGNNAVANGIDVGDAFCGEVLCSFLLVITVFAASDGELNRRKSHAGPLMPVAIGLAVMIAHLALIPVDGCSINPARSFATAVTNNEFADHWVFWLGPLLGGVLATVVWEVVLRPEQPVSSGEKAMVHASVV